MSVRYSSGERSIFSSFSLDSLENLLFFIYLFFLVMRFVSFFVAFSLFIFSWLVTTMNRLLTDDVKSYSSMGPKIVNCC